MSLFRGVLAARNVSKSYGVTVVLDQVVAGGVTRFADRDRWPERDRQVGAAACPRGDRVPETAAPSAESRPA